MEVHTSQGAESCLQVQSSRKKGDWGKRTRKTKVQKGKNGGGEPDHNSLEPQKSDWFLKICLIKQSTENWSERA